MSIYADSVLAPCSVVVPVYHSTSTLTELVARIGATFGDIDHEILLVDDGSPSATWATVVDLSQRHDHVRGLRLGRNFGQHAALLAGVRAARFPITVTMDDDLQNPPEEIPKLLAALSDEHDVVYGSSPSQSHHPVRNLSSKLTKMALASVLGAENAQRFSPFRAFRTDLRDAFAGELGPNISIDALLSWGTSRFGYVDVRHDARAVGRSNYTFRRLARHALDIATGYSSLPLQFSMTLGFATAIFGLLVLAWVAVSVVVFGSSVPGFPFLASTIAIFAGAQLVALGMLGEYIARIHFRVMRKPTYVVRENTSTSESTSEGRLVGDGDE